MEQSTQLIAQATVAYAIATGLTLIVLVFAALFARRQVLTMRRDSERNRLMMLMGNWTDEKVIKARWLVHGIVLESERNRETRGKKGELLKDNLTRFREENDERLFAVMLIPHYFEFASVLLGDRQSEKELFASLFQENVIYYYELFEPWVGEQQARINEEERKSVPGLYESFRQLYHFCIQRREVRQ